MARDLRIATVPGQASAAIQRFDGFEPLESDRQEEARDRDNCSRRFDDLRVVKL